MPEGVGYLSAFLVGLLGGVHCVGMCGGIVGALTLGVPAARHGARSTLPYLLSYNLGRIASYTLAGALVGGLGMLIAGLMPVYRTQQFLFGVAGAFMILLGLYLGGWWYGLARVERAGSVLWRRIEPLGRGLLPVRSPGQALVLGLLWGWLPCGLVYSMLVWSVAAGDALRGAVLMLSFGVGTLPNLLAMGLVAGGLASRLRQPWARHAAGALVIGFGIYTLWQAF